MNTKKELSLSSQLIKLREINNILKQALLPALQIDSRDGGNRSFKVQQYTYSLRDLQYHMRKLKIKVLRSKQVRTMKPTEIYESIDNDLSSIQSISCDEELKKDYIDKLQKIQALLGSIVEYCQIFKTQEDIEEEKNQELINEYVKKLDKYDFPILTKKQIELLKETLLIKLENAEDELF